MMMLKKLSLMGLLMTTALGSHITSAYGMEKDQDPRKTPAQQKSTQPKPPKQSNPWKAFGKQLEREFKPLGHALLAQPEVQNFVSTVLEDPGSKEVLGDKTANKLIGKHEANLTRLAEREKNEERYGLAVKDTELAKEARNNTLLQKTAAVDPHLENLIEMHAPGIKPKIEAHQSELTDQDEITFNTANYGLALTDRELAVQAATDPDEALLMVATIDEGLKNRLVIQMPALESRINALQ